MSHCLIVERTNGRDTVTAMTTNRTLTAINADIRSLMSGRFPGATSLIRSPYKLLQNGDAQTKLKKGETVTFGLSMPPSRMWIAADGSAIATVRPADVDGWQYVGNVCPWADGCEATCIATTGHYGMGQSAKRGWVRVLWYLDRSLFLELLAAELFNLNARAIKSGATVAVRLNVTSDIRWERYVNTADYNALTFYDYTKASPAARADRSANYDLTFSVTRRWSVDDIRAASSNGHRMAVVVPTATDADAPTLAGVPAVNGDHTDERFADPAGVAVLLRIKRPTNGAPIAAIYEGGMVRAADGSVVVK